VKAGIGGKSKTSPFRLEVNVTSRGVFFDRVFKDNKQHEERLLVMHTSNRKARLLAQWILDHVPAQD